MPTATSRDAGEVLVAVDVGTSGARASAFDLHGRPVLAARRSYPTELPREGWAEQDARRWRSASLSALGELIGKLGDAHPIVAIGMTGQCPSVVAIDERGEPLRPGIIYRDNRAVAEATQARDLLGAREVHERTGHMTEAFHLAAKLLWLRTHEPRVFDASAHFLEPSEYVALALTGEFVTDWTVAAASGLLDLRARRWAVDVISELGLDAGKLATPNPSWAVVGQLRPALARRFGCGQIPVVAGAGDSIACAFGAGVTVPGPASEMAGSSSCLNTILREPVADLDVTHYPSAVGPDGYVTEVGINTTGEAIDWVTTLFYGGRAGRARAGDFGQLDREAATVAAGADGLLFAPVLGDGERDDPGLRGVAVGMSLRHDRAAWARATLEGVAFGIRTRIDTLDRESTPATELRVSGRSADLVTWNQIKADVLGLPVRRVPGEATAAGVAMLAGLGVGIYSDPDDAVAAACRLDDPVDPDPANHQRYQEIYERYRAAIGSAVAHVHDSADPSGGD
jgi:xylulokinase